MAFIRSVLPYIEGMRDAVKKRLYVQRLSELTGVEEYRFWDSLQRWAQRSRKRPKGRKPGAS